MTSTAKKIPKQTVKNGQNAKETFTPFERDLNFISFIKFAVEGKEIGAYLSQKDEGSYKITFAWDCPGISPTLTEALVEDVFERIEGGLKDIPEKESLTFHLKSFAEDVDRQLELSNLIERIKSNPDPSQVDQKVLQGLIFSIKDRTDSLKKEGLRKPKTLRLYGTYTYEPTEGETDPVEKIINSCLKFFQKNVTNTHGRRRYQELQDFLRSAYIDGYKQWERIIGGKMGLNPSPLKAEEIWNDLWKRFNQSTPIPLPAWIEYDGDQLVSTSTTNISVISQLLASKTSTPVSSRNYVHCNANYQAVLRLEDKPNDWASEMDQIRYIWEVMADPEINDTECIAQITKGNARLLQQKLATLTRQSISKVDDSAKNQGTVNVQAAGDAKRAIEAQELLNDGGIPLRMSTTFIVHRKEAQDLDEACDNLSAKVMLPALIRREDNYPWIPWLQTFSGLIWAKLYSSPYDLRYNAITNEALGFIPIVKPTSPDSSGFELIASEGNQPIFLDLYGAVRHVGIFATTRAGKSVMVAGMLDLALAMGMPISIMDYPREDGSGTFSEYVPLLKGAYFNTSSECLNLFELPNLKKFDAKERDRRMNDFKDGLIEILQTIVVGSNTNTEGIEEIRAVLILAMKTFFDETQIKQRYKAANTDGFGSASWDEMPTLKDYIGFCTVQAIEMPKPTAELFKAIEKIKLRLNAFVAKKIGKSLSSPSTFRSDSQLFAVALANLSNQEDALIIAMATNLVILRRSLGFARSLIFIDEAPILFAFDAIAEAIGKHFAAGAKSGTGVIIAMQEPRTVYQSKHAAKVFGNLAIKLIGRIEESAIKDFIEILEIPREMVIRCAGKSFFPNPSGFYSQWLLYTKGDYVPCRYYPGFLGFAAVANNPPETKIRKKHMAANRNPVKALIATANELLSIKGRDSPKK
jgi:hypothetical protein